MASGRVRAVFLAAVAYCALTGTAAAGDSSERDAIYAQILANPSDVALTVRYAQLSHKAGDIEAAIGALERILFFRPDEPNARLYLGMLYSALGSHDMARGYYESVLQHPATPEPIKARAAHLMAEAQKRINPHQWNAYVRTGIRVQTNANYQPNGAYTSYNESIPDWVPGTEGDPASDWNVYLNAGVAYSYDFGNQRGDRFEATFTTYNTAQFKFDEFDYNHADVTVGVRFGIPTNHPTELASIKPYLIGTGALLDEDSYFAGGGFGIVGTLPVGTWTLTGYADAIWRDYSDDFTNIIPGSDEFQGAAGPVYNAGIRFESNPFRSVRVAGRIGYERREVDDDGVFQIDGPGGPYDYTGDYLAYDRLNAEIRLPFDLDVKGHQLLVTPLLGLRWSIYDSFDPFVQDLSAITDPVRRQDFEVRIGASFDYAINDWAGLGAQVLYSTTDSNLEAYDVDNLMVSFGPHFRF